MSIDCMAWHHNPTLELGLDDAQAGTHIGFYLGWVIQHDLLAVQHIIRHAEAIQLFKQRKVTGRDILIEVLHESFGEDDLNPQALLFSQQYYENSGLYFEDYLSVFKIDVEQFYEVEHSWVNFDRIALQLDQRFDAWQSDCLYDLSLSRHTF